jgi:hypothetical protein
MANTVYNKKVIEAKAKDLLTSSVNHRSLMTVDTSLAENEGMTKTINVYTYTGKVEKLADGSKNTVRGSISHVGNDYTVQRAQQVFDYTDSDFMKDNSIVDVCLKSANDLMANEMAADFYTEAMKATTEAEVKTGGELCYDDVVDAIGVMKVEDESKLFLIITPSEKASLRKDPDFKAAQLGQIIYNGQIGTVAGIPVIVSNAADRPYLMTNEAIKLFMKEDVEVEQDRDIETKTNTTVLSAYYIVALVDNSKIVKFNLA